MWQLVGLLSLCAAIGFSVYWRAQARWKPSGHLWPLSTPYEQRIDTNKGKVVSYKLGVRGIGGFDFVLQPERWFDRLFKFVGISSEVQVGEVAFDRAWYVVSEDWLLRRALATGQALRTDLQQLLTVCGRLEVELVRLQCQSGRLWIDLKARNSDERSVHDWAGERASKLVPLLNRIAERLRHLRPERFDRLRDRYAWRARAVLAISTGAALYAGFHVIRLAFEHVPFLLHPGELIWQATVLGLAVLGVLVLMVVAALGGTSRAHLVLTEFVLIGGFAFVGTTCITMRDINIELDRSPAQTQAASVKDKFTSGGRRGRSRLYVRLHNWPDSGAETRVRVSRRIYDSIERGDQVEVVVRQGYLGHRWVETIVTQHPRR